MGDCVSAEQRRPNNNTSGQNNRNLPTKPANSKAATKPTPTTVNPTQHKNNNLQPIIRPTLPSALVNPTSNPKLKNDNSAVPNEFFELKVNSVLFRLLKTSKHGHNSSGLKNPSIKCLRS